MRHQPVRRYPVLFAFVGIQVADAVLTYVGMGRGFAEGNPVLDWLMSLYGLVPALALAKVTAIMCATFLYAAGSVRLLQIANGAYMLFAIIPWTILLWRV